LNDLGVEFAVPRKLRTDTTMTTASYPSSTPRWDRKRGHQIRPASPAGIVHIRYAPAKTMRRPPHRGN